MRFVAGVPVCGKSCIMAPQRKSTKAFIFLLCLYMNDSRKPEAVYINELSSEYTSLTCFPLSLMNLTYNSAHIKNQANKYSSC